MHLNNYNLNQFFEVVKSISLWKRIFKWGSIRKLSYDAYEEYTHLISELTSLSDNFSKTELNLQSTVKDNEFLKSDNIRIEGESKNLKDSNVNLNTQIKDMGNKLSESNTKLSAAEKEILEKNSEIKVINNSLKSREEEISELKQKIAGKEETEKQNAEKIKKLELDLNIAQDNLGKTGGEIRELSEENTRYKQTEDDRNRQFSENITALRSTEKRIQDEREAEKMRMHQEEIEMLEKQKEIWRNHQEDVKNRIKSICERNQIEYCETVPFTGSPDNTIKICGEFVVFDAKAPGSDTSANFPNYISSQSDIAKKYTKQENVKNTIYLVVPVNTLSFIKQFYYNKGDYNVFVVSIDALEPVILHLKKLEDYGSVEQLDPEERDNICRTIGGITHLAKRRIQYDNYFTKATLDALSKSESLLPYDIQTSVEVYEQSEILNMKHEKRGKSTSIQELKTTTEKITKEAEAKGIEMNVVLNDDNPLYFENEIKKAVN